MLWCIGLELAIGGEVRLRSFKPELNRNAAWNRDQLTVLILHLLLR